MALSYLDNSATTPLCAPALEKMSAVLAERFGNPSSLHSLGMEAEKIISAARQEVFTSLGAQKYGKTKKEMLIFTASGTEANNLALIGAATAKERLRGGKIIVGETEHPSVIESAKYLGTLGFKIAFIPSPRGVWDMERYRAELSRDTILVSAMLVNNETGAVNDIRAIAAAAKDVNPDVLVHTDAVQGFMKLAEPLASLPADLISISAHKIGGPKGVGALFIKEKVLTAKAIVPIIHGGGQESGFRSGTENTAGIAGFGAAASYSFENLTKNIEKYARLRALLENALRERAPEVKINTPAGEYAKHIVSITAEGVRSETMLHFLSSCGVFVSSGSACSSNSGHGSYVLASFGLTKNAADSTLRVSFGDTTSEEDIEALVSALVRGLSTLSRKRR